jgi:hypothetical protein
MEADSMGKIVVIGMADVTILRDRRNYEITLRTDKGITTLVVSADSLGALISNLECLEYHASMLNPKAGQQPGDPGRTKITNVEHHNLGSGEVEGEPAVILGLKSVHANKRYGLNVRRAAEIRDALTAEIEKLEPGNPRCHKTLGNAMSEPIQIRRMDVGLDRLERRRRQV